MTENTQNNDGSQASIVIHYCSLCQWQLRAAWMAQEILQTFDANEVMQVALRPGQGGVFQIWRELPDCGREILWDRKVDTGFPSAKQLKQRIRDAVNPTKSLGHLDKSSSD